MSAMNRNFVFAYAFLVILPLLGLAGILKSGRGLTAPASIDGVWSLKLDRAQLYSLPCGKVLDEVPDSEMLISQSGNSFLLSFPSEPKITASGTLDGTTLRASVPLSGPSHEGSCAEGHQFALHATIDRRAEPSLLAGTFSLTNCPTCTPVAFQAERRGTPSLKGGH